MVWLKYNIILIKSEENQRALIFLGLFVISF